MTTPMSTLSLDRRIAEALLEISYAVGSVMVIDDILQRICEIGARVMETDTCSIYLIDPNDKEWLALAATKGLSRSQELGVRGFKVGAGMPGWAAANNQTVAVADARTDPRDEKLDDLSNELKFVGFLCTPLRIQEEVVGVMSVRRQETREWKEDEIVFAEIVAKQAAIVLEKARLYNEKVDAERLAAIAVSLSEVAHYIKNILAGMSGGAYFIDSGLKRNDLEKVKSGWDLLRRNNEKIKTLVENMLLFSHDRHWSVEETDLNRLVVSLAGEVEETAIHRKIQISLELDESLPPVILDPMAFHDVLLNLISNAMDAMAGLEPAHIYISTTCLKERGLVEIRVRDTGAGIPEEIRDRILNLFFTTKGRRGTGIGLAVTKKIVEGHDGKLTFETTTGKGTTFIIQIPVTGPAPPPA